MRFIEIVRFISKIDAKYVNTYPFIAILRRAQNGATDFYTPYLGDEERKQLEMVEDFDVEYLENMGEYKISWN